jgi:predicted alpha/beta-hydrolase family hydrolase
VSHDRSVAPQHHTKADGLVLFPGAGADATHSLLVAIAAALEPEGVPVARVDFPYRREGRRSPDRPPVLLATVLEAAAHQASVWSLAPERLALGGRSLGGRMCSMAVADGLAASALVLISYPLHPPGKPDQLRTAHFARLEVPCLFISGTRDAFAAPEELEHETKAIPGPVTHVWIPSGDHALRRRDPLVTTEVRDWLLGPAS